MEAADHTCEAVREIVTKKGVSKDRSIWHENQTMLEADRVDTDCKQRKVDGVL